MKQSPIPSATTTIGTTRPRFMSIPPVKEGRAPMSVAARPSGSNCFRLLLEDVDVEQGRVRPARDGTEDRQAPVEGGLRRRQGDELVPGPRLVAREGLRAEERAGEIVAVQGA